MLKKAKEALGKSEKNWKRASNELKLLNYDSDNAKKLGEFFKRRTWENFTQVNSELKNFNRLNKKLTIRSDLDFIYLTRGWGPDYLDPMTFIDMFVYNGSS